MVLKDGAAERVVPITQLDPTVFNTVPRLKAQAVQVRGPCNRRQQAGS